MGTYWHMDPRIYDENDFNGRRQATAKEIWDGDHQKDLLCEQKGFKLYRIKELDWLNDNINIRNFIKQTIEVNIC